MTFDVNLFLTVCSRTGNLFMYYYTNGDFLSIYTHIHYQAIQRGY